MSVSPEQQVDMQVIEQERRRLSRRLEEVARLCEADVPPATFYGELLKRLLESLAAPAGAVWTRTPQGNLQLQFHVNLKEVGIDPTDESRQAHEELLRQAVTTPGQMHLPPHSGTGVQAEGKGPAGNPTGFLLLLVPITLNEQVGGLIEVFQHANRPLNAVPGFLQYMALMADLGARYQRNQMLGQMTGQQAVWTQLESFTRQIHGSLNPVEVAYLIANEGRRLIECDRVSVGVRYARSKPQIEAISGADVVEKRSNLVQLMRTLCGEVMAWGEKLVFTGAKDDSLPPKVLAALDAYLAESASKLLVVQPLRDERERKENRPRSVLLMECFDPPAEPQQLVQRLDVVAKHATPALYNAVEHRRIPMRFLWMPLAKLQEGLGGKGQAIAMAVAVGLTLLISLLIFVPYPLKMDAEGKLLPQVRRYVYYNGHQGKVDRFAVKPNETVSENQILLQLEDIDLVQKLADLRSKIAAAGHDADAAERLANETTGDARKRAQQEASQKRTQEKLLQEQYKHELDRLNATEDNLRQRFLVSVKSPPFTSHERDELGCKGWTILNTNFVEEMTNRTVRPNEPILRLGAKEGPWEVEMRIPQKHIGQVLHAFERGKTQVLDVDFLVRSDPTRVFKGKLERSKIAGEAKPPEEGSAAAAGDAEAVVICYVRIDGDDIPAADRVPPELLLSGTEVHAKVRCGNRAMGYSIFYGVWEFMYEKVVFFF